MATFDNDDRSRLLEQQIEAVKRALGQTGVGGGAANTSTIPTPFEQGRTRAPAPTPGMLTASTNNEMPPDDDQRPTEDILTEENIFEILSSIMVGTQGVPEGTSAEVLRRLEGRQIDTQAQLEAAINQVITEAYEEAQTIVDTMVNDPEALADMEDPGPLVTTVLESGAMQFAGTTPTTPITTVGDRVVLRGGAGVTVDIKKVIEAGGRVFGENGILDAVVPYIPGISLPNWMPTAGVIFLPSVGEAIDKISTIIEDTDISGAIEEGDIGEILNDLGTIIVGAGGEVVGEVQEQVNKIIGQITGAVTDPTRAGTIIGGVLAGSFPSGIPDWLGGILAENIGGAVYGAVRNVLVNSGTATEEQLPPVTQETPEQDPALMFTHRGDNYFVNKTEDEYFQLAESEDFAFEMDGQYTREQLENTGLETVSSGTYQSLLDDYSFYALTEDIYEYPIEELITRYEAEGGILPGDWDLLDEESRYNFFIEDFRAVDDDDDGVVTDPDPQPDPQPDPDPDPQPDPQPDPDPDPQPDPQPDPDPNEDDDTGTDTSVIEGLFADFLAQMDEQFAGQEDQINQIINNFVDTLPDYNAMPTMEDIAEYFETNGVTLSQQNFDRIRQELANAGYLTQDQLTEALAGVATAEQVQEAIQNAGFATPEQVMQYLAEAGYATPEDITNALANSGFVTEDRLTLALAEAGYATPEQVEDIVNNAIAGIVIPEGATAEEVRQLIQEAIDGIPEGISLDDVGNIVNEAIANIEFPEGLSGDDVRSIVDSFGFATSADVQAGFDDLNDRFDDALNGIATQFSDQEAEFLASITGLEASLIQSLAAVEGGLSTELEMLDRDLVSLREDVANRFDEYRDFTTEQFELAAGERQELLEAIIAANGDINQLSDDMMLRFQQQDQTIEELFANTNVNIEALRQGQISQAEALEAYQQYTAEQFTAAQQERLNLAQEIISVGGQVDQLSADSLQRFTELNLSLADLENEFNVNFEALRDGQISQAEAFGQFRESVNTRLGLGEEEREEILRRQADFERMYGEEQQELQQQVLGGNVLTALAAGGMFAPAPAAPARAPYEEFMKELTYRPREVPQLAIKTPAVDYNEEAQKLLMRTRRRGMLA